MSGKKEKNNTFMLAVAGLFLFLVVVLNMEVASAVFIDDGTTVQILYDCGDLNTTDAVYTMNQSVFSGATCLNVKANNVTIDCGGNTITYSQSTWGYGVNSSNYNLTTVRNCDIVAPTSLINFKRAIYYYKSSNGTIFNNTLTINPNDGSGGVDLESNSSFNIISNNIFTINSDAGNGIYLNTGSSFNIISNNTLTNNGASTAGGGGIYLNSNSNSNILSNNTITVKAVGSGQFTAGISLSQSTNNTLTSNKAITFSTNSYFLTGTTSSDYNNSIDPSNLAEGMPVNYTYNAENLVFNGVNFTGYGQVIFGWCNNITIRNSNFSSDSLSLFNTDNSTISNNIINSNKGIGLWLSNSNWNNITNNNITNSNPSDKGYGLYLYSNSKFNTISNNTIKTSSSRYSYGIYVHSGSFLNTILNNVITTSGWNAYGVYLISTSNNIIDSNTIATSFQDTYGIYINNAYNHTLNNNTITTLGEEAYGILFLSGTNNTLTNNKVNTSQTNSYVFYGGLALNCNNSIDNTNLAEGLRVNFTCNADNLAFDYVDFTQYGEVMFCNGKNITIRNSNFSSDSLNLFGINASIISNNIINTSTGNGLYLSGNSNDNTIANNTIITLGINGDGIDLYSWGGNSINNNITNNIITTSNSSAYGVYLYWASYYNNIINNIIVTTGGSSHGILFESYPSNNNINNNTITTSNSSAYGIYLYSATNNNNLNNNTITTWGSFGYGISLYSCKNNNIKNNGVTTNGSSAYGIHLYLGSENNTFSEMNVKTNGTTAYAIYLSQVSLQTPSYSFVIRDSILNSSRAPEFLIVNSIGGGEWNFTNVTRANGRPINITWQAGGNGTLNMHWYLDTYVHSGINNLQGANVTSYDNTSAFEFSELTPSNGRIRKTLLEYTRNETSGTNYTRYSPYNMSVTKTGGYTSYYNSSINLSNNVFMDIELAIPLSACGTLSVPAKYTLSNPIGSDNTCITVTADNVTLDCRTYQISDLSTVTSGTNYRIYSTNNFTAIKNCNLYLQGYWSCAHHSTALFYNGVNNGTIENTTVLGAGRGIYVYGSNNNITNTGVTVYESGSWSCGDGVDLSGSNNVLKNNVINASLGGVDNSGSNNVNINNNILSSGIGISISNSNNHTNINNTITSVNVGIAFSSCSNSTNINNTITTSGEGSFGLYFSSSPLGTSIGNKVNTSSTNSYVIDGTQSSHYNHTIDSSNWAEGRPVNYTYNADNLVFDYVDFTPYGQVMFGWSRNITIRNSNFSRDSLNLFNTDNSTILNNRINASTGYGLWLYYNSTNNNISNNIVNTSGDSTHYGIYLYRYPTDNNINNNTIATTGSNGHGIYLYSYASNNTLSNNIITTISGSGIYLSLSSNNNTLSNNIITPSDYGIWLLGSSNNNNVNNTIRTFGDSDHGIFVSSSDLNNLINNIISTQNLTAYGILLYRSSNNNLAGNQVNTTSTNSYVIDGTQSSHYNHTIDVSNLAEGLPVNYTYNAQNLIFEGISAEQYGQFILGWSRNITIKNSNFSRDSLNLFYTNGSTISNININTSTGYGLWLYVNSNNNHINNGTIITNDDYHYGIPFFSSSSDGNTFSGMDIMTNGKEAYAVYLPSSGNQNFAFFDSILNSSKVPEFYRWSASGIWNFTNVTDVSGNPITFYSPNINVGATLNMHWYLDVYVHSGANNMSGANVTAYNNLSAFAFSQLTGSDGRIRKTLLGYTTVFSNPPPFSTNISYSPYNLTVNASGYPVYSNSSISLSNNVFMDIDLGCGCPVGSDWIVSLNCTMIDSICNMPSYKVICTSGSLTMTNYTIIADKVITPIGHGCLIMDNRSRVEIGS